MEEPHEKGLIKPHRPTPSRAKAGGEGESLVLQGLLERITFRSEDTGFSVMRISPEAGFAPSDDLFGALGGRVAAVGKAPETVVGDRLRLVGRWEEHPEHGKRFAFDGFEALPPLGPEGLKRYLSSSRFRGIGAKLAERIVKHLGSNTLTRIREDAHCLAGVPGLRPAVAIELAKLVDAELGRHELTSFLYDVGLNVTQADSVARALGAGATEVELRKNPYVLARKVHGVGFQTADKVARELGFDADSSERRAAALLHASSKAASDGHSCLPASVLFQATRELLRDEISDEELALELRRLERAQELVLDEAFAREVGDPLVYPPALHVCETRLANNLRALSNFGDVPALATRADLAEAAKKSGLVLHADQESAVLGLLGTPVGLLTGGPGVGKTTIVRLVVELAEKAGRTVALASPTGRAAKRLSEACRREAKTIHRLLAYNPQSGGFQHDTGNPLEADIVVIDEISMLDVILAHHLVKAIQPPTRLILVGDPDQLPSVAAGNVLAELLQSERFPIYRLRRIFRQKSESLIVHNAHRILAGEVPEFPQGAAGDFFFFGAEGEDATARRLVEVVTQRLPARFGVDWARDVQVLAPMYRGACGVDALNENLRRELGFGGREVQWRGRSWREGDRVIQTRNDYDRGVYNGDMGRIHRIAADGKTLTVKFPERVIEYATTAMGDLQPAFAITVHRSQGAEFPVVVMPLVTQHAMMLRRHLLYTAITRAKELVVLVGSRRALGLAVRNAEENGRESALAERLRRAGEPGS